MILCVCGVGAATEGSSFLVWNVDGTPCLGEVAQKGSAVHEGQEGYERSEPGARGWGWGEGDELKKRGGRCAL